MGWAARANPRSLDGGKSPRMVTEARIAHQFAQMTPAMQKAFLDHAPVTAEQAQYLKDLTPKPVQATKPIDPGDLGPMAPYQWRDGTRTYACPNKGCPNQKHRDSHNVTRLAYGDTECPHCHAPIDWTGVAPSTPRVKPFVR